MEARTAKLAALAVAALLLGGGGLAFGLRQENEEPLQAATLLPDIVSHVAAGAVPVPPAEQTLGAILLSVGQKGAEPTLGVTRDGTLLLTGFTDSDVARMWRSTDRGATWREVAFPLPRVDFDPYLWVDPDTDRAFSVPLYKECSNLMWSDDAGATWEYTVTSALAGCPHTDHDHQSLTTGRPRGVATQGYDNVVYYAYQSMNVALAGTYVTRSLDGGSTWTRTGGVKVFEADCQGGLAGAPVAAPDGTLYLPKPGCDGILIGVSEDSGITWRQSEVRDVGIQGGTNDRVASALQTAPVTPNPAVAVDAQGNAYVLWTGGDALPYLSTSTDRGVTWSAPVRVSPPDVRATVFTAAVAGGPGRVALAYLATTDDVEMAHTAGPGTSWHLYVTMTGDALSADPRFTTLRATPGDDPVQRGCIWQAGGEQSCRNLRDYLTMRERDGRVFVAYADGCARCASADRSLGATAHVAVVEGWPSLRDGSPLSAYRP